MKNLKKVNESASRKLNGGAVGITVAGVAAGLLTAWGVVEAGKGFINLGIDIGNAIFKNNAKHI